MSQIGVVPTREVNKTNVLENVHLAPDVIYHLIKEGENSRQPHGRPFTIENGKVIAH